MSSKFFLNMIGLKDIMTNKIRNTTPNNIQNTNTNKINDNSANTNRKTRYY